MTALPRTAREVMSNVATRTRNDQIGLVGRAEAVASVEETVIGRGTEEIVAGIAIETELIETARESAKRIGTVSGVLNESAKRMHETTGIDDRRPLPRLTAATRLVKTVIVTAIRTEIVSGTASHDDPVVSPLAHCGTHRRRRTAMGETMLPGTDASMTILAVSSLATEMHVTVMPLRHPAPMSGARAVEEATAVVPGRAPALGTLALGTLALGTLVPGTPRLGILGLDDTSTSAAIERNREAGRDEARREGTQLRGESDRGDRKCLSSARPRLRRLGLTTRMVVAALGGRTFTVRPVPGRDGTVYSDMHSLFAINQTIMLHREGGSSGKTRRDDERHYQFVFSLAPHIYFFGSGDLERGQQHLEYSSP
jgi:hypothetical protein